MSRLTPRFHNVLSYTVAAVVFLVSFVVFGGSYQPWGAGGGVLAALWTLHFARRAAESAWLHVYSGSEVAHLEAISEYAYYWVFAVLIARSAALAPPRDLAGFVGGLAVYFTGEIGNFYHHMLLAGLRNKENPAGYVQVKGGLFEVVACPHYFFEVLTWLGLNIATPTVPGSVFALLSLVVLTFRARARAAKQFRQPPGRAARPFGRRRKVLIPFVI